MIACCRWHVKIQGRMIRGESTALALSVLTRLCPFPLPSQFLLTERATSPSLLHLQLFFSVCFFPNYADQQVLIQVVRMEIRLHAT
ncbi:uncharacterized protein BO66DRAFT_198061 [Aspergillus aculeatinus CBS 121060]|uniref:Uncharacterized protein n=1 Tax=Aspergillus aculeatinus CBS 121060 TaxID=1448322 RepID=A0ACD1GWG8_9EURO|nr:hypothetical protein BO66DRAFT_198061 [Aspergillus aculeatinus CBS 121060]RAH65662.1 hypothetical protein BO66DRAFT_198061 [Aspergillus aculeatinus CBS 121060]